MKRLAMGVAAAVLSSSAAMAGSCDVGGGMENPRSCLYQRIEASRQAEELERQKRARALRDQEVERERYRLTEERERTERERRRFLAEQEELEKMRREMARQEAERLERRRAVLRQEFEKEEREWQERRARREAERKLELERDEAAWRASLKSPPVGVIAPTTAPPGTPSTPTIAVTDKK